MITCHLLEQTGFKADEAASGAVALIQRFGSAASLNIHLHCLVLDGVYRRTDGEPVFVEVPAPTDEQLQELLHKIIAAIMEAAGTRADPPALGPASAPGDGLSNARLTPSLARSRRIFTASEPIRGQGLQARERNQTPRHGARCHRRRAGQPDFAGSGAAGKITVDCAHCYLVFARRYARAAIGAGTAGGLQQHCASLLKNR